MLHARGSQPASWYPLDVLHFPLRSREQCARKYRKTWTGWDANLRGDIGLARRDEGAARDTMWERVAVGPEEIRLGLAAGSLAVDTRLRDALRVLREGSADAAAEMRGERSPSSAAVDGTVFEHAEHVRLRRRLDELDRRAHALEAHRGRRAKSGVS